MSNLHNLEQMALARQVRTQRAMLRQTLAQKAVDLAQDKLDLAQSELAHQQEQVGQSLRRLDARVNQESTGLRVLQTLHGLDASRRAQSQANHVVTKVDAVLQGRMLTYDQARSAVARALRRTRSVELSCERMRRADMLHSEMLQEDWEEGP